MKKQHSLFSLLIICICINACFPPSADMKNDGGTRLVLEIGIPDNFQYKDSAIARMKRILYNRIDKFGITNQNVEIMSKNRILVEIPGKRDLPRLRKILITSANLEFWETYDNRDIYPMLEKANKKLAELRKNETEEKETKTPHKKENSDNLTAQLEQIQKTKDSTMAFFSKEYPLFKLLSPSAKTDKGELTPGPVIGFCVAKDTAKLMSYLQKEEIKYFFPADARFLWSQSASFNDTIFELIAIKTPRDGKAPLTGNFITEAKIFYDSRNGDLPEISIEMNKTGAFIWKELTRNNIGKSIAIVVDNKVYSYPTVMSEIDGGKSSITGKFTKDEANDLVNMLQSGELEGNVKIIEETVVPPLNKKTN